MNAMARTPKQTASEADGLTYRRARTWEIAFSQMNNGSAMVFYTLVGLMSYLQNAGYGIAVAAAGRGGCPAARRPEGWRAGGLRAPRRQASLSSGCLAGPSESGIPVVESE
ncbi:hypothetical protein [Promicromonospora sp. NPDC059942]|uniref:hypothetical protein n=1 Tax=Promicromonospora sp. NPDC059942 TaxID=3347009 RepID=UPI003657E4CB